VLNIYSFSFDDNHANSDDNNMCWS